MPAPFQLFMLVNAHTPHSYPYVAINPAIGRIINICEEHIAIVDPLESYYVEKDYMPTSRTLAFDLELLDKMVADYIGPHEYNIVTRFTPEKHTTLRYHSPTNEGPKDYDIYLGYPDQRAEKLVEEVYLMMEEAKVATLGE
ncbi:MAG: hypothetical protein JWQ78_1852 [Sediminibacterium sp.]|nr:hypothetical protein [Sediminibacterium sp.]